MEKHSQLSHKAGAMDRRAFLRLSGLLGLGVGSACIVPAAAEAVRFNRQSYKVSKTRLAMGTFVSMTVIHTSKDQAEQAMGLAFEEIDRLTMSMNRFDASSPLARLNSEGCLSDAPPELAEVVGRSLQYYRVTRGTFDISVKPVVDLFKEKFSKKANGVPSDRELRGALDLVGSGQIALKGRSVSFGRSGMGITLDGVAKGYIVDRASKVLSEHKIQNHLINAGGDIRTMGVRKDKKPWTVAIQDPLKKKQYPDIIQMTEGAIATSGNYEVYFDREKMFHHIVDPRTGLSPLLSESVSVTAQKAVDADALSTSVFVMNPETGVRFIEAMPGCECLVVVKGGKIFRSTGWRSAAI